MKALTIYLYFSLCFVAVFGAQEEKYRFDYLSVEDGLSQNEVTSIAQDEDGFMWFGTQGGLNRYDAYNFKHYKPTLNDTNSLPKPSVETLLFDQKKGQLNLGLKSGGFVPYDVRLNAFQKSKLNELYDLDRILSFYNDSDDNLWIGTWSKGVLCIGKDTTIQYESFMQVRSVAETPDGSIWLATATGLYRKQNNENTFKKIIKGSITSIAIDEQVGVIWLVGWSKDLIKFDYTTLKQQRIKLKAKTQPILYTLLLDKKNKLWVGTWGEGLYALNRETNQLEAIKDLIDENKRIRSGHKVIRTLFEDRLGDLWIGTHAGIVKISKGNNFHYLDNFQSNNVVKPHINNMLVDKLGRNWIGTNGDGLYFSQNNAAFVKVKYQSSGRIHDEVIKQISEDAQGNIWVSIEEGLFVAEVSASGSVHLKPASQYFNSPDLEDIRKVQELFFDGNDLWLGTQQEGVYLCQKKDGVYSVKDHIITNSNYVGNNRVTNITKDADNRLWFATYKGLYSYNPQESKLQSLKQMGLKTPLVCDIILCLEIDKQGNLWFGTPCSLNRLNLNNKNSLSLDTYTVKDGLPDDYVSSVIEDDEGQIWLSTNAGLSSINIENKQILNFDKADGIGSSSYSEDACFKDDKGMLYFGGTSSLTYFMPSEIKANTYNPPIVFSDFSVLNSTVEVAANGLLKQDVNLQKNIELTHKEVSFSFTLAALDYNAPHKNLYAYRLLNSDDNWSLIGNKREITFNNIKPGKYTLQVKGTNSNGIWSDQIRSIQISVLPPPWKSVQAIILYLILVLFTIFVIIRTVIRQEHLKNIVAMEKLQNKQAKQINNYKLNVFTNISHEFRTPLTLILAPISELMNKDLALSKPDFYKDRLCMINDNARKLYNLVNQLLEFRKGEAGKLKLSVSKTNLRDFITQCSSSFYQLAKIDNIQFKLSYKAESEEVYIDSERIAMLISNLLSNAFKHVTEKGKVSIVVSDTAEEFKIAISNDGKTISKSELSNLFERFYQAAGNSSVSSSGIGLQLVKRYAEMHKGAISVKSNDGEPITFTVTLKKGYAHFSADELTKSKESQVLNLNTIVAPTKKTLNNGTKGSSVLVVEDNDEVRNYLCELIGKNYNIIEACEGYDGLEKANTYIPDLIVSDVMMPRMDGYELCEKVKTSEALSHIPVILLTAKVSESEQLFGTQKGADLYLKKPFVPEILLEDIKQLIASRNVLKKKFTNKIVIEASEQEITSEEAEFLKKSIKIVEDNMAEANFSSEILAQKMAMSSSTFYRRIKKATDQTPASFIKTIRIKRAAQLLKDTDLTVSEIIDRVGYLDSRSFRKNFKEIYNDGPTEFRNK